MLKTKRLVWVALLIIGLTGCNPVSVTAGSSGVTSEAKNQTGTDTLNVYAAASLSEVFTQIGTDYEVRNPGVRVVYNFAGSQQLDQQIKGGAPADVFASAATKQMEDLEANGFVVPGKSKTFARNHLVVIYPSDNPAHLLQIQDLARPGIKIIMAAKEVPAGQYTLDFIDKAAQDPLLGAAFSEKVLKNVISYEENVEAVVSKVALGEADAGIAYASDASGGSAERLGWFAIPDTYNITAVYPIATVKTSPQQKTADAFVAYILSSDGQKTLARYGFLPGKP